MPSPTPSPTRDATSTRRGLMGVAAQTFSGVKTFLDAIKLALRPTVDLPAGGAELEGHILYDSTLKRPQVHDGTSWKPVVMATSGTDATSLEEHLTSTSAHAATSITYGTTDVGATLDTLHGTGGAATVGTTDSSGVTGSNVQAQIAYLGTSKVDWATFASEAAAGGMGATPSGGLSSTNVQGQLDELDSEKVTASTLVGMGGTAMVGAPASAAGPTPESFAAGTSRSQLDQLLGWVNARTRKAISETITALWTFSAGIISNGTNVVDGVVSSGRRGGVFSGTVYEGIRADGAAGQPGGYFVSGTASTSTQRYNALSLEKGDLNFFNTVNPACATAFVNTLVALNIVKAFALIKTTNSNTVSILNNIGFNVTSVVMNGARVRVTFASPFTPAPAAGGDPTYLVIGGCLDWGDILHPVPASFTATTVDLCVFQTFAPEGPVDLSASARTFWFFALGGQ